MNDFDKALLVIASIVKADPFRMEPYRKMAFWARLAVLAKKNNKPTIFNKAKREFATLWCDENRPHDVTGTIEVLTTAFV